MQRSLGPVDDEVVDQLAVAIEGLRADPEGPGRTSRTLSSGTKRCSSETKERLLAACRISVRPVRQKRAMRRQVPGQARFDLRSCARTRPSL